MRDPEERDTSLALRAAHGNRLRKAVKLVPQQRPAAHRRSDRDGRRRAGRLPQPTAPTGKDALLICDTWEMADALNRRLHDTLTAAGPTAHGRARPEIRVGDIIMSRSNDATIDVATRPGTGTRPRRPGPQRQPLAGRRDRPGHQPRCRRTAHRQSPRGVRRRLPARARHAGLRGDRALGAGRHRRQLLRDPGRRRLAGDGLCGDDPRPAQQRGVHLPKVQQRSRPRTRQTGGRRRRSTSCGAATSTRPRTTSGRSWPTTTGPAPCTPKPNAPSRSSPPNANA